MTKWALFLGCKTNMKDLCGGWNSSDLDCANVNILPVIFYQCCKMLPPGGNR